MIIYSFQYIYLFIARDAGPGVVVTLRFYAGGNKTGKRSSFFSRGGGVSRKNIIHQRVSCRFGGRARSVQHVSKVPAARFVQRAFHGRFSHNLGLSIRGRITLLCSSKSSSGSESVSKAYSKYTDGSG